MAKTIEEWAKGWNLDLTPKNRPVMVEFCSRHRGMVTILEGEDPCPEIDHAMFVDDMEGCGLDLALMAGDLELAEAVFEKIMRAYPPGRYHPFANDFQGTPPEDDANN